jgi:hypothetical protein
MAKSMVPRARATELPDRKGPRAYYCQKDPESRPAWQINQSVMCTVKGDTTASFFGE